MDNRNQPALSVVLPVFNAGLYLEQAIESVLQQTFTDFELLLVYDDSLDNSLEIIQKYLEIDSRVRLVTNTGGKGLAAALNFGISQARANLIARFDADDICYPNRFEKQLSFLRGNPEVKLVGSYFEAFGACEPTVIKHPTNPLEVSFKFTWNTRVGHPTVIFDKKAIQELGGYPKMAAEDYALFSDVAMQHRVSNIPEVLVKYRVHPANKSTLEGSKIRDELFLISGQRLEKLTGRKIDSKSYVLFHHGEKLSKLIALSMYLVSIRVLFKMIQQHQGHSLKVIFTYLSKGILGLTRKFLRQLW